MGSREIEHQISKKKDKHKLCDTPTSFDERTGGCYVSGQGWHFAKPELCRAVQEKTE